MLIDAQLNFLFIVVVATFKILLMIRIGEFIRGDIYRTTIQHFNPYHSDKSLSENYEIVLIIINIEVTSIVYISNLC